MGMTPETARRVFRELLGRDPENDQIGQGLSVIDFAVSVAKSEEYRRRVLGDWLDCASEAAFGADDLIGGLARQLRGKNPFEATAFDVAERGLLLQGRMAAATIGAKERLTTLVDAEFKVSSQWGEDGIIEWLVQRLPDTPRRFVEFGVESYLESNTRFLMQNRGWSGLVLDGSEQNISAIRRQEIYWKHDLIAETAFVTRENINELISRHDMQGDIGFLGIDIDGNDYWVLEAIDCVRPHILAIEFNPIFGDRHAISIPYDANFERFRGHSSGQYYGASIKAMAELAERKGFTFVGTNSNGVNAFFVRSDLAHCVLPALAKVTAWPARHRDARDESGQPIYARGLDKARLIAETTVIETATGNTAVLKDLFPLYSDAWLAEL
jgi:hypothetical protein